MPVEDQFVQVGGLLGGEPVRLYDRPKAASAEDLSLMGEIDRRYLGTPLFGSRRMKAWRPSGGWRTTSGSTTGSGPTRLWATGLQPRYSTGIMMLWKGTLMEGGVHLDRKPNHWQESRDSHLTRP